MAPESWDRLSRFIYPRVVFGTGLHNGRYATGESPHRGSRRRHHSRYAHRVPPVGPRRPSRTRRDSGTDVCRAGSVGCLYGAGRGVIPVQRISQAVEETDNPETTTPDRADDSDPVILGANEPSIPNWIFGGMSEEVTEQRAYQCPSSDAAPQGTVNSKIRND